MTDLYSPRPARPYYDNLRQWQWRRGRTVAAGLAPAREPHYVGGALSGGKAGKLEARRRSRAPSWAA